VTQTKQPPIKPGRFSAYDLEHFDLYSLGLDIHLKQRNKSVRADAIEQRAFRSNLISNLQSIAVREPSRPAALTIDETALGCLQLDEVPIYPDRAGRRNNR